MEKSKFSHLHPYSFGFLVVYIGTSHFKWKNGKIAMCPLIYNSICSRSVDVNIFFGISFLVTVLFLHREKKKLSKLMLLKNRNNKNNNESEKKVYTEW